MPFRFLFFLGFCLLWYTTPAGSVPLNDMRKLNRKKLENDQNCKMTNGQKMLRIKKIYIFFYFTKNEKGIVKLLACILNVENLLRFKSIYYIKKNKSYTHEKRFPK